MRTRVLVVDDSATIRALLTKVLQNAGMDVVIAHDGLEAMERLSPDEDIHVIVTDLRMPNMDGKDLIRAIRGRERLRAIPVIMLTSSAESEDHRDNLVAGANDYIQKDTLDHALMVAKINNYAELRKSQIAAEQASWTDGLTQLGNRRFGEIRLEEEVERARRYDHPLSVCLVDIDHFKKVNDTLGHAAGDDVLKWVASRLTQVSRGTDIVSRWGGEEFLFAFPETTLDEAAQIMERFRAHMASSPVNLKTLKANVPVTISGGVAELEAEDTVAGFVDRADRALYQAKEGGRNRLLMWQLGQLRPVAA